MVNNKAPKLEWVVLYSHHLQEIRDFYQDLLGVQFKEEQHPGTAIHYSYQAAGLLVELYPHPSPLTEQETPAKQALGLGLSVPDLDEVVQKMKDYVVKPIAERSYGRAAGLEDPDGRKIILFETRSIPPLY